MGDIYFDDTGSEASDRECEENEEEIMKKQNNELVHPGNEGFVEKVTPKAVPDTVFFYKCTKCGGVHFRHAGYIETMVPFIRPGDEKKVSLNSESVKICVKCKAAFVWVNEQMYDVTDQIDLGAWEATEKEAHKATGPGGQC